jgi:hypothetical protein
LSRAQKEINEKAQKGGGPDGGSGIGTEIVPMMPNTPGDERADFCTVLQETPDISIRDITPNIFVPEVALTGF